MKHQVNCSRIHIPARLLMALSIWLIAHSLPAQDIHVYYDLFADSVYYRQNGRVVKEPKIRKGDRVLVHFTEYNPYLYDASVEVDQRANSDWSGGASAGAFQSLVPALTSLLPGGNMMLGNPAGDQPLTFLDIPLLQMGENSIRLKDLFNNSRGAEQLLEQAKIQLQELAETQAEMSEIYQEIQTIEKAERVTKMAQRNLDQLVFNPQMKPSMIKKVAKEYLDLAFPGKNAQDLQLDDAFQWQDRPATKQRLLLELQGKQQEFDTKMNQLSPITQQLSDLDLGSADLEGFAGDLRKLTSKSKKMREQVDAYVDYKSKNKDQDLTVEEIMDLQLKFRELSSQSFMYDCAVQVEEETVIINATFTPRDTLANGTVQKVRSPKTKAVKLDVRGGMHFGTGIGVGFGRLFDLGQTFDVRDNTIVADNSDFVQPSLATFIHFYANNRRGPTLAGTFGLGIPLSGSNISAINFYLGPSLMIGRGQRIVISTGLLAGPVKRLAKGLHVGDEFDPNGGDIPLQTRYELGYFVGISFNMGR